jgi:hypothetical protein
MSTTLEQDLRERWLPSAEQMRQADALLAAGYDQERECGHDGVGRWRERGVYTTHLLINKDYGIWTADVKLVFLDGVFTTREAALDFVHMVAEKRHREGGEKLVGGYAWHPSVGEAAVWDDICSQFPDEER